MAQDNVSEILSSEAERQLSDLQTGLQNATNELEKFAKVAKGITIDFKGVKDFATLTELQDKVTAATKKMEKAQRDFADEIDRAQAKEIAAVNKFVQQEEKRAAAIAKSAAEAEKAAKREAQAIGKLTNDYEILKKAYIDQANYAKQLGVTLGTNNEQFKQAAASAMVMYDRLLKVEKAVGQAQRQVGQYNQAAFAMQQILRETPSFAYSMATGFLAMSNNIPILVDEISRLKAANLELTASGGKAIPIWKTLASSIFSFNGLLTLGIAAITIYTARMGSSKSAMSEAEKIAKKYNDTLEKIDETHQKSAVSEQARIASLLALAKNTKAAMDVRLAAIKSLQEDYPDYLGNIEKEKFLTGDLTKEVTKLNESLMQRALMMAATEKIAAAYTKIIDAEREIAKIQREALEWQQKALKKDPQAQFGAASFKSYNARTAIFVGQIDAAKKEIEELQKLADKFAAGAGKLAFDTTKGKMGKDKTKERVSPTNEAIQSAYDASIQELTITKDKNKLIADDEKRSLEERLQAYNVYNAAVLAIMQQQKNKEINNEALKYKEIQDEKKGKSGQELKNLIDQEQAVITRIDTIRNKAKADTLATTEKAKKDQLAIIYGANEQWIKSEEFRNEKLKELQIGLFLQDAELLKRQLAAKEITQRQYNDKMKQLRKTEGVMLLDDDIALYEKILANDQITAEKRLDIQRKLNNALKAKSQMSEGQPMRKSGRLTDGLAQAMGMTGEAEMQEFYDRSIALANQAADAIIDAKRRQYEAEMGMLDRQKEAIDANYQLQYDYINATTKDETEKANKIAQLQAQKQAQDAEIDGKKREVAKRMAAAEKTAAIASIIQSTAVAIAGALKYGPAALPIIALITSAGAVQLAAAANAPIPAYAKGTDSHKGGLFFAGDGGEPEYIKAPNKAGYWSASSTTLYNEPKGTTVTPMSKFVDVVGGYKIGGLQKESERKLFEYLGDKFAEHLWQHGENLSHVIMSAQPKQQKQDLSEAVIKLQRLGR